jgi:hypothetical protein
VFACIGRFRADIVDDDAQHHATEVGESVGTSSCSSGIEELVSTRRAPGAPDEQELIPTAFATNSLARRSIDTCGHARVSGMADLWRKPGPDQALEPPESGSMS